MQQCPDVLNIFSHMQRQIVACLGIGDKTALLDHILQVNCGSKEWLAQENTVLELDIKYRLRTRFEHHVIASGIETLLVLYKRRFARTVATTTSVENGYQQYGFDTGTVLPRW